MVVVVLVLVHFVLFYVHAAATEAASVIPSVVSSGIAGCLKCGTIKKHGKRSCCARGGTWFDNCGDDGDTHFDHTWIEGIRACKGGETEFRAIS